MSKQLDDLIYEAYDGQPQNLEAGLVGIGHKNALALLTEAIERIADLTIQRDGAVTTATELGQIGGDAITAYKAEVARLNKIIDALAGAK